MLSGKNQIYRQIYALLQNSHSILLANQATHERLTSIVRRPLMKHFSVSCRAMSKNRTTPEEEESIFGDTGSGFGSAVPVSKKPTSNESQSQAAPSKKEAQGQSEKENPFGGAGKAQSRKKDFDQEDFEEEFEIIEEKSKGIPREVYQWIFLVALAGSLGYLIYSYKDLETYFTSKMKEWRSPVTEIFLPPIPDNVPYEQRKPVLVINVDDLLLHVHYDGINFGTRVQKRPHLKQFLEELSKVYEIVLFADSSLHFIAESVQKLEQTVNFESHKLGLEYTTGSGRGIVKDLSKLGRPLTDVVFVEWKKNAYKFQPENAIVIPRWKGETNDSLLLDLLPFLYSLSQAKGHSDFRDILKKWGETKEGEAAKVETILQNYNEFISRMKQEETKKKTGWFGKLFGK